MVKSMTGFSRIEKDLNGVVYSVELKSLNSKYLNVDVSISDAFSELEIKVSRYLRENLKRGTIKASVDIIFNEQAAVIKPNFGVAASYYNALNQLADRFRISDRITLDIFTRIKDVMKYKLPPELGDKIWTDLQNVLAEGLGVLSLDREREGENLAEAMKSYLDQLSKIVEELDKNASGLVEYYRDRLSKKISDVLSEEVDKNRLEQEIAILAERADISEEIVRLGSHIESFNKLLMTDKECGVQLDFLCQEMHREFSTIASKSKKLEITSLSIEGRTIVNKLREQVQNIE